MKRLLFCLLLTLGIYLAGLVLSYASGSFVCMKTDASEADTIGVVHYCGFPIWFYEQAPGISIMGGWNPERFEWNNRVWWGFLLLAAWAVSRFWRKRSRAA